MFTNSSLCVLQLHLKTLLMALGSDPEKGGKGQLKSKQI